MLEDLKIGVQEFKIVGKFLEEIKKEFREGDDELRKVAELKQVE